MSSNRKNLVVLVACLLLTGAASLLVVAGADFSEESFGFVLRWGARVALLIYLLIFIARPLRQLSKHPLGRSLVRNRRFIGIGFAAVMTVHLVFLLWHNGPTINLPGFITYAMIYLMLITSFDRPTAWLGPKRWRLLHKTGVYWLAIAYSVSMFGGLLETGGAVYAVFAVLIVLALALRFAAFVQTRRKRLAPQAQR
jgi:DMSO/TMAO reductase YedYZ heme-binding membrane subunit